jgi:hypothetical protein
MAEPQRLHDVDQSEVEDAAWQVISDPKRAEMHWERLGRCNEGFADNAWRGLYQGLAMRVNPEFGESVRKVLPADHPAQFWFAVLPDGDPVTAKLLIHEEVSRAYLAEAQGGEMP